MRTAQAIKDAKPDTVIGFVGGHVTARPEESLRFAGVIDYVARKEFDLAVVGGRRGPRRSTTSPGISFLRDGTVRHRPTSRRRSPPSSSTRCRSSTEVYARDLDYKKYNSPYCQYPYVSLYTGRGCPARCTFCLWPQVTTGHSYRTRSVENVLEEVRADAAPLPRDEGDLLRRRHLHRRSEARASRSRSGLGRSASPGRPTRAPTSTARR